jgi:hypothetical protein
VLRDADAHREVPRWSQHGCIVFGLLYLQQEHDAHGRKNYVVDCVEQTSIAIYFLYY